MGAAEEGERERDDCCVNKMLWQAVWRTADLTG